MPVADTLLRLGELPHTDHPLLDRLAESIPGFIAEIRGEFE
jgi:hypothetical protein